MEDGTFYLRLRTMSHTIYAAKFEQTINHQHVHIRWESQSHAPVHAQMRLYPIDKSLVCLQREKNGFKTQNTEWPYFSYIRQQESIGTFQ